MSLFKAIGRLWKRWFGEESSSPTLSRPERSSAPVTAPLGSTHERWEGLLRTLRLSPSKLMERLEAELARGLSFDEKVLAPPREGQFFDGLIIGRKVNELDALALKLDSSALSDRLNAKCPTLAQWALGEMGEDSVLGSVCPEIVAWARQGKKFKPGVLRESHLAEAIEAGQERLTRAVLAEGGQDSLTGDQARRFMDAFGERREAGLSKGLDAGGLDAFAQAMGGWEAALESVGSLSLQEAMNLIEALLKAIQEESLADEKVLGETKAKASKKARELIARAMALQAARSDRPRLLRSVLAQSQALLGMSPMAAANLKSDFAKIQVGSISAPIQLQDDEMSLYEVAWLSQAPSSQAELKKAGAKTPTKERQRALANEVEGQVRRQAMRADSGSEIAKVWRETLREWKGGVLGGAKMSELQKVVDRKLADIRKPEAGSGKEMKGVAGSATSEASRAKEQADQEAKSGRLKR